MNWLVNVSLLQTGDQNINNCKNEEVAVVDSKDTNVEEYVTSLMNKENDDLKMSKEGINLQVKQAIEKNEDVWKCKI